jgi:hypothetical protein
MESNGLHKMLIALIAALGLALVGCPTAPADDDDDDDASDDDVADDDTGDDDTVPEEDCWDVYLSMDGVATYENTDGDDHVRYSVSMTEDVVHVIAKVTWDEEERTEWEFGIDVGEGTCPDNGIRWAGSTGTGGEVVVDVYADDIGEEVFPLGVNMFAHVRVENEADFEIGATMEFDVDVQFCQYL